MKTTFLKIKFKLFFLFVFFTINTLTAQNATEIIKQADEKMQGESNEMEMTMQIVRPTWTRTVKFKSWTKGRDFSITLITAPAKEKGQTFLKRKNDMWSWNPSINRMIKLPPSMMSQGWMGSDYTNDDLLKESSIVVDYTHKIIGSETIAGKDCYKIELRPKEGAAIVWGKQLKWISKDGVMQLKSEYYDEDEYLVRTELASDIKVMDGREIPTKFEIIPADDPENKTLVIMNKIKFDIEIEEAFFSQQNMKKLR